MRFFLISDNNDTRLGMRLTGIEGVVVHEPDEVNRALSDATAGGYRRHPDDRAARQAVRPAGG